MVILRIHALLSIPGCETAGGMPKVRNACGFTAFLKPSASLDPQPDARYGDAQVQLSTSHTALVILGMVVSDVSDGAKVERPKVGDESVQLRFNVEGAKRWRALMIFSYGYSAHLLAKIAVETVAEM